MYELENNIIVLSDLHLKLNDKRQKIIINFFEKKVLNYKNLIILGDFFEFFYSFPFVVPSGYIDILKVLKDLSTIIKIFYIEGNHDFGLRDFFNIRVFTEKFYFKINNKIFIAIHGDTVSNTDLKYKFLRKFLRNNFTKILMDNLPPYILLKISEKFSSTSKLYLRPKINGERIEKIKNIFENSWVKNEKFDYLICGHFHENFNFSINNKKFFLINSGNDNEINYLEINSEGDINYKKWIQ